MLLDRQKRNSSGAFDYCDKLRDFCVKFMMTETGIFQSLTKDFWVKNSCPGGKKEPDFSDQDNCPAFLTPF